MLEQYCLNQAYDKAIIGRKSEGVPIAPHVRSGSNPASRLNLPSDLSELDDHFDVVGLSFERLLEILRFFTTRD